MAIKLTWLQLAHPGFQNALEAIWDCPMLDARTSYTAHRIKLGIKKTEGAIRKLRLHLIQKYGKKGEDGKLLNDEHGRIIFESPEDNKKFEAEFQEEFSKRSLDLPKVSKLNFENLAGVRGITPSMWEFLEPILENLPPSDDADEAEPDSAKEPASS